MIGDAGDAGCGFADGVEGNESFGHFMIIFYPTPDTCGGLTSIVELLNKFEPESDGLLREISKHVNDEMLRAICSADYALDADKHLVALRQVRDTGTFPQESHWFPMEVLELIAGRSLRIRLGNQEGRVNSGIGCGLFPAPPFFVPIPNRMTGAQIPPSFS